jgi:PAS domain S-box-containing protein
MMSKFRLIIRFAIVYSLFFLSLLIAMGVFFGYSGRANLNGWILPASSNFKLVGDVLFIVLLMIMGGTAIGIWLKSVISDPVTCLKIAVEHLKQGELEVRIPETTQDELGDLARGFNAMASELQTKEAQLQAYAADLEKKVEERTESLKTSENEARRLAANLEQLVQERTKQLAETNQALEAEIQERRLADENLRQAEMRYRMLIEQIPAVTYIASLDQNINLYYSPQIEEMTGYPPEEWVGSDDRWTRSLHPDDRPRVLEEMEQCRLKGVPFRSEYRLYTRDGRLIWIQDRAAVITDAEGRNPYLQGVEFEITDRKLAEEQTRLESRRSDLLAGISRALAEVYQDVQPALVVVVKSLLNLLGNSAVVRLVSEDGEWLMPLVFHTNSEKNADLFYERATKSPQSVHETLAQQVLVPEGAFFIPEQSEDEVQYHTASEGAFWAEQVGAYSLILVPLRAQGRILGTLGISRDHPGSHYSESDLAFVKNLADRIALAIANSRLYLENLRRKHELEIRVDERTQELRQTNERLQTELAERQHAESELAQSQRMLEVVLNNIPQRIFWKDRHYVYLGCNLPFAEDAGVTSPAEIIGKDDFQLRWKERASGFYEDDHGVMESDTPKYNYEAPQMLLDGNERWLRASKVPLHDSDGSVMGILGTYEDITEQKQAEQELHIKDQALQSSINGFLIADLSGMITFVNPAFLSMWSFTDTEKVLRLNFLDLWQDGEEAGAVWATLQRHESWRGEMIARRVSGSSFIAELSINYVLDEDNEPVCMAGSITDITERKRAEDLIAQQTRELARSNAELEQFAYVASHDLQEPLRMVASYTQLLARRMHGKLDKESEEYIGYAVDGATRMQHLINDLLSYSRVSTKGKPFRQFDLNDVLEMALNNLQVTIAENGAEVTHDPLPVMNVDPSQMAQLLQNLIGNAIKFHSEAAPRVHVSAVRQESSWRFSVQDNGIGIEPQFSERIFIIFQRLHDSNEYPGTGIGLAICKKIVERHGGKIWVESDRGKGATFIFTIPEGDMKS